MPLDEEYFDKVISGLATREDLKAFATSEDLKAYATMEDLEARTADIIHLIITKFDDLNTIVSAGFTGLTRDVHALREQVDRHEDDIQELKGKLA